MQRIWSGRLVLAMAAAACLSTAPGSNAMAEVATEVVTSFDGPMEGLAVGSDGNLYVSGFFDHKIYRVEPGGKTSVFAELAPAYGGPDGITVGMAFDGKDTLYVAHTADSKISPLLENVTAKLDLTCRDATVTKTGLYGVSISTGKVEKIVTRGDGYGFCFPDDPAVGPDGSVYLSDLRLPGIWKIDPVAKTAVMWSADPLLWPNENPSTGARSGPNGVTLSKDGKAILAATSGDPKIISIPILADGSAGPATVVSGSHGFIDGLEIDADGNYYITEGGHLRQEIWMISANGRDRELIANNRTAPVNTSASLIFWNDKLCVANLGLFDVTAAEDKHKLVCFSNLPKF